MYSCFGLWVDAVEICPRNRPRLCNSIHNSFHKHNMEATLSHMQTHGQIKDWGIKRDRVHFKLLAKSLTVCLNESLFVTGLNRPDLIAGGTSAIFCTKSLYQLHANKDTHWYNNTFYSITSSHNQIKFFLYKLSICFSVHLSYTHVEVFYIP